MFSVLIVKYQILMKLDFSGQIFEKYSNVKINDDPFSCSRFFHADRRTDWQAERYDEANSLFSQFLRTRLKFEISY